MCGGRWDLGGVKAGQVVLGDAVGGGCLGRAFWKRERPQESRSPWEGAVG